jgi:hypothetical protein
MRAIEGARELGKGGGWKPEAVEIERHFVSAEQPQDDALAKRRWRSRDAHIDISAADSEFQSALLHNGSGDSLRESRCVDGWDAQASLTAIPYDELERI